MDVNEDSQVEVGAENANRDGRVGTGIGIGGGRGEEGRGEPPKLPPRPVGFGIGVEEKNQNSALRKGKEKEDEKSLVGGSTKLSIDDSTGDESKPQSEPEPKPKLKPGPTKTKTSATAKRFFSAYAQTWIGMTPLWLMGEAVVPGRKVGGLAMEGGKGIWEVGKEVGRGVGGVGGIGEGVRDVVIIVDKKIWGSKGGGEGGGEDRKEVVKRMGEVVKAAG